jgi:ABC-type Fe2+-enterobactin transport system substrate-binding protein
VEDFVRKVLVSALFAAAVAAPVLASAATVDPTLVPDGTYVVKVEKVEDSQHATVLMDNGVETTLVAQGSADFSKIKANETIKISLIKGKVPVYAVQ